MVFQLWILNVVRPLYRIVRLLVAAGFCCSQLSCNVFAYFRFLEAKMLLAVIIGTLVAASAVATAVLPPVQNASAYHSSTFRLVAKDANSLLDKSSLMLIPNASQMPEGYTVTAVEIINNVSYDALGWDFVQVTVDETLLQDSDRGLKAYYTAGFAEGYATYIRIGQIIIANNLTYNAGTEQWMLDHLAYMKANVAQNSHQGYPSPFWTQVGNFIAQMEGITDGYMRAVVDNHAVGAVNLPNQTLFDIFVLNLNNEISDIANAAEINITVQESQFASKKLRAFTNKNLHCSALVKVTPEDVFFSHVTWGGYNTMLRQYKVYQFQTTVSFSSVAGTISSGDDWYLTSTNLSVQETTNDYYNMSLVNAIVPQTVSEFLRVMVANFVATTGPEWVALFSYNNSGTYCNQWMVLDYKLYTPGDQGSVLKDNLLWVAEQIPGLVMSGDMTDTLRNDSYWASFNIPYFPYIYNVSGFLELYEEFGDIWSYTKYARPEIFKRNQSLVKDLESMRAMMRYNDWQNDPFSVIPECPECNPRGSPWLAIASRGDLVLPNFTLPANANYSESFENIPMGAIDAKIASYSMLERGFMGNVICGPTSDQQPVFVFDVAYPGNRPPGSANVFDFPWVFFSVAPGLQFSSAAAVSSKAPDTTKDVIIGICVGVPVGLIAVGLVVFLYRKQKAENRYVAM